ncbi:MAG: ribonuclease HI family protein [Coriobacteriia bacterium]|nr:ribonuclease HI family protein [Coriobacteriia bacterium]MBN2847561.1 ribonuclease HI family protein [Coriobacteriia bacterium]
MSGVWTVNSDGGSRGNPGPGAAGIVVRDASGQIVARGGSYLGEVTNNVAEYEGVLWGMRAARALGAESVRMRADSELVVKQMRGEYRVKNEGLKPLFLQAQALVRAFAHVEFEHVRREANVEADALANEAMDARSDVGDAPEAPGACTGTLFGREV